MTTTNPLIGRVALGTADLGIHSGRDRDALTAAQKSGDVLAANAVFMDAFYTDVRADLAAWRESRGLPGDPMAAYLASGHLAQIAAERVGGTQAGWGA